MGSNVRVRLLCDRGFVDAERVELWTAWGWDYVIRIRRNTMKDPAKRDRLLMLAAYTQVLLTLLGAAGEACGLNVTLHPKSGASQGKKRIYSLFRQGCIWFTLLPSLPEQPRGRLLDAFEQILQQHQLDAALLARA